MSLDVARIVEACRALAADGDARPLPWVRWTPPQDEFYRLDHPRIAFRAGNQLGKTWAGIRWIDAQCRGTHPCSVRPPPIEAMVVCTSWSQSVAIMRKFRGLVDPAAVDSDLSSNFSVRSGYGKDNPTIIYRCGSILRFRTTNQGAEAFQGATVHAILIDEPTDIDIYRELDRRLTRTAGRLAITYTPANRDCRWLRELTESGVIREVHAKLTEANLTPAGAAGPLLLHDGTPMSEAWIREQWRTTPSSYAPVVLDGEWEASPDGLFFDNFDGRHVSSRLRLSAAAGPVKWVIGVDHATAGREFGQVAIVAAVQRYQDSDRRTREAIMVLGEAVMSGTATSEQFARRVVGMLAAVGVKWEQLSEAWGDNPALNRWAAKSNRALHRAVARELGRPATLKPAIGGVKEGRGGGQGSVDAGCRYLYEAVADNLVVIHPRCKLLIDAFRTWDYGKGHPAKDRIDALRYALRSYISPRVVQGPAVRLG